MAQKLENRVTEVEAKVLEMQAVIGRDNGADKFAQSQSKTACTSCTCEAKFADILADISKLKNDVQGLKMRMGKK